MKYYAIPNPLKNPFYYRYHSEATGNAKANTTPLHIHQSAEFMIVTKGEMKIQIGTNEYETVKANQGVFIPSFQPHKYNTLDKTEYIRCNFSLSLVPEFMNAINGKESSSSVFAVNGTTVLIFYSRILKKDKQSSWSILSFLHSAIEDYLSSVTLTEARFDSHILTKAITYMNEHKSDNISIGEVASKIGYSESHLSYCINKSANMNFATLLAMLRIEEARVMLKNSDKSILEIAIECGFGSERSFYRQFKSITGFSPKDYRKTQISRTKNEELNKSHND